MIVRVFRVTAGPPEEPEQPEAEECPMRPFLPGKGHALICLGDLMEESVTWIEVDSEDDCNSPKAADLAQAAEEEEDAAEEPVPPAMRDIYRQQRAGGIVAGMQKCLSF
jgi:hypothetical protein